VKQFDVILAALAVASIFVVLLADLGVVALAGSAPLALHRFYIVAAAAGWLFGNLYVARVRSGQRARPILLAIYCMGPISPLFLLRAMASEQSLDTAPLVPLFGCGVFLVLFFVPVMLQAPHRQRVKLEPTRSKGRNPPLPRHDNCNVSSPSSDAGVQAPDPEGNSEGGRGKPQA
jgi:hypothetical protein